MECYENEAENPESEPTMLYNYFDTLKKLRIIRMNFDGARYTTQHLHALGDKIQFLFRLEELFLNFNETVIDGDDGLIMLSEGISEMAQLQKFHLTMDFTQISDPGFNAIAQALGNKHDLNELVLSFIETQIQSNQGLRLLGRSLKDMENLETFDICITKTKAD